MSNGHADRQFSYDEEPLTRGAYREWFWKGLDPKSVAFLGAPVKQQTPPAQEPVYKNQEQHQPKGWHHEAACKDTDPVVFFSEGRYPRTEYLDPNAQWRQLCPTCPVRELCLQSARDVQSVGIFGGKIFVFKDHEILEMDDDNIPRRKYATNAEKSRAYRLRKKENAGVSNTGTH
jgi:hypothetical protein